MKEVKYVGKIKGEIIVPNIKGIWQYNEWREITDEEYELIKDNKDFIVKKPKKKEE